MVKSTDVTCEAMTGTERAQKNRHEKEKNYLEFLQLDLHQFSIEQQNQRGGMNQGLLLFAFLLSWFMLTSLSKEDKCSNAY